MYIFSLIPNSELGSFFFSFFFLGYVYGFCNGVMICEQLVSESEKLRMKKLEELSKNIDSMH